MWRVSNLYKIKAAETGRIIEFKPRPEQEIIFEALFIRKLRRIIILKARRLGMSTAIDVAATDLALFNEGIQISIADLTQDAAFKKLEGICRTAFRGLPDWFKALYRVDRTNDSTLSLGMAKTELSSIFAGKNARGGTNQFLHLSELGVIQADDPKRFEETMTGAIPSAQHGTIVIETTWKGGRGGKLYEIIKKALERPPHERTDRDWHVFFFPWWVDPTYTLEEGRIDPQLVPYFEDTEAKISQSLGRLFTFTDGQKRWYSVEHETQGLFMFREYPSTMEEMFKAPIEGAIYAECIDRSRSEGRICEYPVDNSALVHTVWDIGSPMNTVTVLFQMIGYDIRIIEVIMHRDWTPVQRVSAMLSKGYPFGDHFLPHDTEQTEKSGRTYTSELMEAGLTNIRTVPKTTDIWIGINRVRQLFPRFLFRKPETDDAIDLLAYYHTQPDTSTGIRIEFPVHDHTSHVSDAFRILGEAEMSGFLRGGSFTASRAAQQIREPKVSMGVNSTRTPKRASMLDVWKDELGL